MVGVAVVVGKVEGGWERLGGGYGLSFRVERDGIFKKRRHPLTAWTALGTASLWYSFL